MGDPDSGELLLHRQSGLAVGIALAFLVGCAGWFNGESRGQDAYAAAVVTYHSALEAAVAQAQRCNVSPSESCDLFTVQMMDYNRRAQDIMLAATLLAEGLDTDTPCLNDPDQRECLRREKIRRYLVYAKELRELALDLVRRVFPKEVTP